MSDTLPEIERLFRELYRRWKRESGILLGKSELTNGDYHCMSILHRTGGALASEIASEMGVRRGYVSQLVKRLEAMKLLQKSRIPGDARAALLRLTARGENRFASLEKRIRTVVRGELERLSEDDRQTLHEILKKLEKRQERG